MTPNNAPVNTARGDEGDPPHRVTTGSQASASTPMHHVADVAVQTAQSTPSVPQVRAFIAAAARDPSLTVHSIAARFQVSARRINRLFAGQERTPTDEIRRCRVALLASRLETTAVPVTALILECGFGSVHSAYRAFALELGTTPSRYRSDRVPQHDRYIAAVHEYIDTHYQSQALRAEEIAKHLNFSVGWLHRLFADQPRTVAKLVRHIRVEHLCERLASTDETFTELARQCGFGSLHSAYRSFAIEVGITPSEYRALRRRS